MEIPLPFFFVWGGGCYEKMRIGVVGCGYISSIYFENLFAVFDSAMVQACSDMNMEQAKYVSLDSKESRLFLCLHCILQDSDSSNRIILFANRII